MAFVTVDLAESGQFLTSAVADPVGTDATMTTEGNLNDGLTTADASGEIRGNQAKGYKITHDLGFAVADIDTLAVRVFDGTMMSGGLCSIFPYTSGDVDVASGNGVEVTIPTTGVWTTFTGTAGFIADLEDVGTNQISIRVVGTTLGSAIRGRFTEIELEFTEAAGGGTILPQMMHAHRQAIVEKARKLWQRWTWDSGVLVPVNYNAREAIMKVAAA